MPKGPFTSHGRQTDLRTPIGARDARTGLGYGILQPATQKPRQMGAQFPYYKEEPLDPEDETIDQETADAIKSKSGSYRPSDFGAAAGSDPFYFAGGNTKLKDCFWRTDSVLSEIAAFSNSMAPIPHKSLYPGAQAGLSGGPFLPGKGKAGENMQQTGTVWGWSHAPVTSKFEQEEDAENLDDDIFNLEDLANKILQKFGERSH